MLAKPVPMILRESEVRESEVSDIPKQLQAGPNKPG
jgi:hypothetical protein